MTKDETKNYDAAIGDDGNLDWAKCVFVTDGGGRIYVVMSVFQNRLSANRVFKSGSMSWKTKYIEFSDATEIATPDFL